MKTAALVATAVLALATGLGAQDALHAAKDLYASAAYEDALTTLSAVTADSVVDVRRQADQYRAFCLFALGRTAEAESVVETIIKQDPLARLDSADASPRVEAMFTSVRKRLLPSIIREHFRLARAVLDRKDYAGAEPHLVQTKLMMAEAETLGIADDGFTDLHVLVDGFLDLIHATTERRAAAQPAAAAVMAPAAASTPARYTAADEGITPPVAINQRMPSMSGDMLKLAQASHRSGILEVVIDENGDVQEAVVIQSLVPGFDESVVALARRWKYKPATKGGVPVRYTKTIALVVPVGALR